MAKARFKLIVFSLVLLAFVLVLIEGLACVTSLCLVKKGWMAYIPHFSKEDMADYLSKRSDYLGWGPKTDISGKVFELAPLEDPAFPVDAFIEVSTYGDSFTFGGRQDETYSHYLALALGCRVANYGVGGYGSDQALMRFRSQVHLDKAPVVVLGHLSENILRNVNQYRNLLYPGGDRLSFKPRFVLEHNQLQYIPLLVNTASDLVSFESDPHSRFLYDEFLKRPLRKFPYSLSLLKWCLFDYHLQSKIKGVPRYIDFYKSDHPSGALMLTIHILKAFSDEASHVGKKSVLLLIPTCGDFKYFKKHGKWIDQPLADSLMLLGLNVVHAAPKMHALLAGKDSLFLYECENGHFNARGYKMLAEVLAEGIRKRGLYSDGIKSP